MKTVTVNAAALKRVLIALNGPAHYIRELQATRNLPLNPIEILTDDYNTAGAEYNKLLEQGKLKDNSDEPKSEV